jgi:hypothetical protein
VVLLAATIVDPSFDRVSDTPLLTFWMTGAGGAGAPQPLVQRPAGAVADGAEGALPGRGAAPVGAETGAGRAAGTPAPAPTPATAGAAAGAAAGATAAPAAITASRRPAGVPPPTAGGETTTDTGAGSAPTFGQPPKATSALASTNSSAAPAISEPAVPKPAAYARIARTRGPFGSRVEKFSPGARGPG